MKTGSEKSTKALSDTLSLLSFLLLLLKKKTKKLYYQAVSIVIDNARTGQYLVVHSEDDHQLPEDGDEVQEEFHTLPSHKKPSAVTEQLNLQPVPDQSFTTMTNVCPPSALTDVDTGRCEGNG